MQFFHCAFAVAVAVAVAQIPLHKSQQSKQIKIWFDSYELWERHAYISAYVYVMPDLYIYIYIPMWHLWHVACEWRHSFCLAARFHFGISILFPYLTRAPSLHIFCRKPSIVACIAFLSKPARDSAPAGGRVGCMCGGWHVLGGLLKI